MNIDGELCRDYFEKEYMKECSERLNEISQNDYDKYIFICSYFFRYYNKESIILDSYNKVKCLIYFKGEAKYEH